MNNNSLLIRILYFIITVLVISSPALINGYPILYLDSHNYISQSISLQAEQTTPIGYGLFIRAFSWQASLWPVVFAQSLLVSLLLFFTIRSLRVFKNLYILHFASVVFLTMFTAMGYVFSQIMADFFAPVLILSVYLLFAKNSGIAIKIFAFSCIAFSSMTHFSLQILLLALVIILPFLYKLASSYSLRSFLTRVSLLLIAFFLGFGINYAFYYSKYQNDTKGGVRHVIIMGRLVETGILDEYLNNNCDDHRYALCDYKGQFPRRLTEFVWEENSPFYETGGWNNSAEEYNEIIYNVFTSPYYLGIFAYKGFISGFRQLVCFKTGIIKVYPESKPNNAIKNNFPHEYKELLRSKQRYYDNTLADVNYAYYILVSFSLIMIMAYLLLRPDVAANLKNMILMIMLGVFLNGMLTGAIAGTVHRFQARVNWLLVFIGLMIGFMLFKELMSYLKKHEIPPKN